MWVCTPERIKLNTRFHSRASFVSRKSVDGKERIRKRRGIVKRRRRRVCSGGGEETKALSHIVAVLFLYYIFLSTIFIEPRVQVYESK